MKSKVLSLILALTVLCSILSVSTVSFAAVDKGDEIIIDGSADFVNPGASNVYSGNVNQTYDERTQLFPIIQVENTSGVGSSNGNFPRFEKSHNLDITQPFTIQFDYFARGALNVALSLGNADMFICMNNTGKVYLTNGGTTLTPLTDITLTTTKWHTVALTYDGTEYSVYADGVKLSQTFTAFKEGHTNTDKFAIGLYSGSKKDTSIGKTNILVVDEVYAYQSVYEPPVVETDVITIAASASAATVTASATFSDTYATGEYCFWLATYDAQNRQLIGITNVDIDAAGYKELKITFETTNAFSNVDYAKAFVWAKENYTPTGVKALLGSEPQ